MNPCTIDKLSAMLALTPLTSGKHKKPGGGWCILEARSQCAGIKWTDDPVANRTFDIRPINDIPVRPRLRTEWMPRVMEAYEGALDWPHDRQIAVASKLAKLTMRLITSLPDEWAADVANASILDDPDPEEAAANAADALNWAVEARVAAGEAKWAAQTGADAAEWEEVEKAAREEIFIAGCELWIEAAACN